MAVDIKSAKSQLLSSEPIKFRIGCNTNIETFWIHPALVMKYSPVFDRMINGHMSEAVERMIKIEDTMPGTFTAFMDFVYFGNYQLKRDTSEPNNDNLSLPTTTIRSATRKTKGRKKHTPSDETMTLEGIFSEADGALVAKSPPSSDKLLEIFYDNSYFKYPALPAYGDTNSCDIIYPHDWSWYLLAQAEVYVFSEKYNIDDLKCLALNKIYSALRGALCSSSESNSLPIDGILGLADYTFNDDHIANVQSEKLREMVALYLACHSTLFVKEENFMELLDGNSALMRAFTRWTILGYN